MRNDKKNGGRTSSSAATHATVTADEDVRPPFGIFAVAVALTLLLHGVFFGALGFLLARIANQPVEPLIISIEFAEVEQGDSFEEFFSDEQPGQDNETQEEEQEILPEPEPEVEEPEPPPPPEPEPILTQPDEPAPTLPEPEVEPLESFEAIEPVEPIDDYREPSNDTENHREPTPPDSAPSSPASQASQPSTISHQPSSLPAARNVIKPVYPFDARRRGQEGLVIHDVTVSEKGVVTAAVLVEGSGYPELDRAARKAIMAARFSPAIKNGAPVAHVIRLPIEFKLVNR